MTCVEEIYKSKTNPSDGLRSVVEFIVVLFRVIYYYFIV